MRHHRMTAPAGAVPAAATQVRRGTVVPSRSLNTIMLALMMNACMLKRAATIVNQAATPAAAPQAVLVPSEDLPADAVTIRGYDFNDGRDLDALLESMLRTGLQATALGQAINEINRMVGCQALE